MTQQGWRRGPHSRQQDDWWQQLYDPGSPDTGSSRSGDTLDDRYASVRRTMGPATAPGRAAGGRTAGRDERGRDGQDRRDGPDEPEGQGGGAAPEEPAPQPPPNPSPEPADAEVSLPDADADASPVREELPVRDETPVRDEGPTAEGVAPSDPRTPGATAARETARTADSGADDTTGRTERPRRPDRPEPQLTGTARENADAGPTLPDPAGSSLRPGHVGERPPTYDAEPATFPAADPSSLTELVPDTVLDGAHYGGLTLRAASLRGDSARHRGALRRDALLTARFGSGESALLLVAVAAGGRAATGGHRAAREICHSIGGAVGRSHVRLAEDIRADRRGDLKYGLQRLTDRCYGKLRAQAAALGMQPEEYTADLRCLLLSADPRCRMRVFFGAGAGGVFRLRSGAWRDLENSPRTGSDGPSGSGGGPGADPAVNELDASELGDPAALSVPVRHREAAQRPDATVQLGTLGQRRPARGGPSAAAPSGTARSDVPAGPSGGPAGAGAPPVPPPARPEPSPFRFVAAVARPGDRMLLCSPGLAEPLCAEPAFAERLARSWSEREEPPGLAAFLADVQLRVRGYADDRTAVAVWED